MNPAKYSCWSAGYDLESCPWRRQFGIPLGYVTAKGVQQPDEAGGVVGKGVLVGGIPVGDAAYQVHVRIKEVISREEAAVVSYIKDTVFELHGTDHYDLWSAIHYCCQFW